MCVYARGEETASLPSFVNIANRNKQSPMKYAGTITYLCLCLGAERNPGKPIQLQNE
eukprot:m.149045 g.149045  ORF g.149045 m.149045 type:complete len:57 (-) comp13270_c0_seq1:782-952(-)